MSVTESVRAAYDTPQSSLQRILNYLLQIPSFLAESIIAWTLTLPAIWATWRWLTAPHNGLATSGSSRLLRLLGVMVIGSLLTLLQLAGLLLAVGFVVIGTYLLLNPSILETFDLSRLFTSLQALPPFVSGMVFVGLAVVVVAIDRWTMDRIEVQLVSFPTLRTMLTRRLAITRSLIRVGNTMILMGLSLLPISSLLLALPAANPSETVLTETVPPVRNIWESLARRVKGLVVSLVLLLVMLAFAVEMITLMRLPGDTFYGLILRQLLSPELAERLPYTLVEHWPHVLLVIYLIDLLLLVVIGRIPHQYSIRNMIVRWRITLLTVWAFVVVLFMLTFMLAFVNGMTKLTENSAIPGNVMMLSDGATDELFSNLGYGDVSNIDRIVVTEDEFDQPLPKPITVKTMKRGGKNVYMSSRETYCVVNQVIPGSENRRRFVQLRIVVDVEVSAAVHNLRLLDQNHEWFSDVGVDQLGRVQCVLGQGVAATLGEDLGKKSLEPGDSFELADLKWVVTGIMKTEGTTYGSEIWCSNVNTVTSALGKKSYTTLVVRVSDETEASARAFAYHVRNRYQTTKLKAVTEKEYFADLNKNNQQTLYSVIVVSVVMAIGGVFGVMNTMFAAIAQRTRDIGVLRLLGFKRWQVLVSFLLESMVIAVVGGLIGIALGYLTDGFSVTSIASGGQGGGKSVSAKLIVDLDVVLIGTLFTLVMGRLGGLVPALSAMRLEILESLR